MSSAESNWRKILSKGFLVRVVLGTAGALLLAYSVSFFSSERAFQSAYENINADNARLHNTQVAVQDR